LRNKVSQVKPAVAMVMVNPPQSAASPPESAAILRKNPKRGSIIHTLVETVWCV
jgi:hypothetical protein